MSSTNFSAAAVIKEIGRGKHGARSMNRSTAAALYSAMLKREISDLELGAILLALRIKGESVDEMAGFLSACRTALPRFAAPPGKTYAPVVIPSYNGARKRPNLLPLLALLLAREGVPVLLHGVLHDAGRVSSAEILQQLGIMPTAPEADLASHWQQGLPVFMAIDQLAPEIAGLLNLRARLGVRNSTHTLVKLLQPFDGPALRLSSYTHPEYLQMLSDLFRQELTTEDGAVMLMRATEGEAIASTSRAQQIEVFYGGHVSQVAKQSYPAEDAEPGLPASCDAATTAAWIRQVLDGALAVPDSIANQVRLCREWSAAVASISPAK